MEENNNKTKEVDVKTKRKKAKIAVISLCTIVVLFIGLQVYASTNGYGNVFFMIKNLITTGTLSGEEEIFSDKEITLSYKSIELAEGLKIQVNRLEIKDGKTKIYTSVRSNDGEVLPLEYRVKTLYTDGAETEEKEIIGNKPENSDYYSYEDVLTLDYEVNENSIITLKIIDNNDKVLRTLEINMETREITVTGESELKKISEIELRKYLDIFSLLNYDSGYTESDNLIEIASKIQFLQGNGKAISTERESVNERVKQIYGENAKFETTKDAQDKEVEVLKDMKVAFYDKQSDSYEMMEHDRFGKCLKIEDISFENEIYTVKYVYLVATGYEKDEDKLEDLPQYEATIKLKRDESNLYSKYQVISITDGVLVKEKVNITIEENINDDEVLSNVKQTLKSTWYTVYLYENDEIRIKFTGEDIDKLYGNIGIDKEKSYPIIGISGKVSKMFQANNGGGVDPMTFFILEDGTVEYIMPFDQIDEKIPDTFIIDGASDKVQNVVDLKTNDSDVVIAVLKNGEEVKIWNEWREFDQENENVNTDNNTNTTSNNSTVQMGEERRTRYEKYAKQVNFAEFKDEETGVKFKYPDKFQKYILAETSQNIAEISGKEYWGDSQNAQLAIYVFRPKFVKENSEEYNEFIEEMEEEMNNFVGFTTNDGDKWKQINIPFSYGEGDKIERYINYKKVDNGYIKSCVDFMLNNEYDGDLDWIESEILASYEVTANR